MNVTNYLLAGLAALVAAPVLTGCAGTPPPVIGSSTEQIAPDNGQEPFASPVSADYRLRPADVVSVVIYREPDLSLSSVPVSADGRLSIPLIGSIPVSGMTAGELAASIARALESGFLINPQVAVNVVKYDSHTVTVEGSVKKPGVFPFAPGSRLSSAIALAEGPMRQANLKQVAVFRRTSEGTAVAKFDYRAMQAGTMIDPVLAPGDRVVVGTSGLSQFWQDVLQSLPAFAIFSNI